MVRSSRQPMWAFGAPIVAGTTPARAACIARGWFRAFAPTLLLAIGLASTAHGQAISEQATIPDLTSRFQLCRDAVASGEIPHIVLLADMWIDVSQPDLANRIPTENMVVVESVRYARRNGWITFADLQDQAGTLIHRLAVCSFTVTMHSAPADFAVILPDLRRQDDGTESYTTQSGEALLTIARGSPHPDGQIISFVVGSLPAVAKVR